MDGTRRTAPPVCLGLIIVAAELESDDQPPSVVAHHPPCRNTSVSLDIAMMVWMLEMCFFTARRGVYKVDLSVAFSTAVSPRHSETGEPVDMDRDVLRHLDKLVGWLAFLNRLLNPSGRQFCRRQRDRDGHLPPSLYL